MGQRHTEQSMIIMVMIIFLLLITLMTSILSSKYYDIFYDNYGDRSKIFFFVHLISDCLDLKPENLIIIDLYKQYYFLKIRNLEVGLKSAYGSVTF